MQNTQTRKPYRLLPFAFAAFISILLPAARGENFELQLDTIVSPGVPGAGAGNINPSTSTDTYTFYGTNGQVVFLEEISVAATFAGWLYWDLKSPSGVNVSSGYFQGTHEGRKVLPETGTYTIMVKVLSPSPSYIGDYSFQVRTVTPDQVFPIAIGDSVSKNVPASGAGNIDKPGANDIYEFTAPAGKLAFFERVSAASAFGGWLTWELRSPTGKLVFRSYFSSGNDGRVELTEAGVYKLRVFDGTTTLSHVGDYAFRIRDIPPDQIFAIQFGQVVTNGVPAPGAGNIEVPGAYDYYTFQGNKNQSLFFEDMFASASLGGWGRWETRSPSGTLIFADYLGGAPAGRYTLPEAGTYTIRCAVASTDPALFGTYSFRVQNLDDAEVALTIGQLVTNGVPAAGAGNIEQAGSQDLYTFQAAKDQKVVFHDIAAAAAFNGWLQMELRSPSSNLVFKSYFQPGRRQTYVMPESGTYKLKVDAGDNNPAYYGTYSFRTYSEVFAHADKFEVAPGTTLGIPGGKLLCNDKWEAGDNLTIDVLSTNTTMGGLVTVSSAGLVYTPKAGFNGTDTFIYRISGQFGDDDTNLVSVVVSPGAGYHASVVSLISAGPTNVMVCLLGAANQTYDIEESVNLQTWTKNGTLTADGDGSMTFYYSTVEDRKYYRFMRK